MEKCSLTLTPFHLIQNKDYGNFNATKTRVIQRVTGTGFCNPLNDGSQNPVPATLLNPATDLIPVCPNCHAMLHRGLNGEARTIEELKDLLQTQ